jgi:hypothetical protein
MERLFQDGGTPAPDPVQGRAHSLSEKLAILEISYKRGAAILEVVIPAYSQKENGEENFRRQEKAGEQETHGELPLRPRRPHAGLCAGISEIPD